MCRHGNRIALIRFSLHITHSSVLSSEPKTVVLPSEPKKKRFEENQALHAVYNDKSKIG